jgi:hypothetical protein
MKNCPPRLPLGFVLLTGFTAIAFFVLPALAWGEKGHAMQARTAIRALPAELPAFFRAAEEEMAFLITEPDRWRTSEQPALTETTGVNHTFKWELAPKPLPANRHLFIIELTRKGTLDPANRTALREFGLGPYGIQEWAEARPFTAARLADGARMVRDVWYTAWVRSGRPVPKFETKAAR